VTNRCGSAQAIGENSWLFNGNVNFKFNALLLNGIGVSEVMILAGLANWYKFAVSFIFPDLLLARIYFQIVARLKKLIEYFGAGVTRCPLPSNSLHEAGAASLNISITAKALLPLMNIYQVVKCPDQV